MTNQLLAFARKQNAMPSVLDIDAAMGESLPIMQRVVGEKVDIHWYPSGAGCRVRIDPSQLDQVLMSLCMNARDAMNGDGQIVIKSKWVRTEQKLERFGNLRLPGEYALISVSDAGQGISEEHKPHIFEPFYTTKKLGKGTGLGLSSIYGIVKQNRGFVDFESQQGKGTIFFIYLPIYIKKTNKVAEKPDVSGELTQTTILVVEDEPEILSLCKVMLEKAGFTVLIASCPSEAIMIAEECSGKIDLLLTDIVMPEMNGTELSSKLATISPGLRVLFMSDYSVDILNHPTEPSALTNIIRKPFTIKALTEKVYETIAVE